MRWVVGAAVFGAVLGLVVEPKATQARTGDEWSRAVPAAATGKLATRLKAGRTALDARQYARAERAFLAALVIDPTNPDALTGAAYANLKRGDYEEALDMAERALAAEASPSTYALLGDAYAKLGQFEAAAEAYAKAATMGPHDAEFTQRAQEAEALAREAAKTKVP